MTEWALSIHPQHWEAIVAGTKRFELRRRLPSIEVEDRVYVYVTKPVRAVCGSFTVAGILREHPHALWEKTREAVSSTSRDAFFEYFEGVETGTAIVISDVVETAPVAPWFSPPQYVTRLTSIDASPSQCRLDL